MTRIFFVLFGLAMLILKSQCDDNDISFDFTEPTTYSTKQHRIYLNSTNVTLSKKNESPYFSIYQQYPGSDASQEILPNQVQTSPLKCEFDFAELEKDTVFRYSQIATMSERRADFRDPLPYKIKFKLEGDVTFQIAFILSFRNSSNKFGYERIAFYFAQMNNTYTLKKDGGNFQFEQTTFIPLAQRNYYVVKDIGTQFQKEFDIDDFIIVLMEQNILKGPDIIQSTNMQALIKGRGQGKFQILEGYTSTFKGSFWNNPIGVANNLFQVSVVPKPPNDGFLNMSFLTIPPTDLSDLILQYSLLQGSPTRQAVHKIGYHNGRFFYNNLGKRLFPFSSPQNKFLNVSYELSNQTQFFGNFAICSSILINEPYEQNVPQTPDFEVMVCGYSSINWGNVSCTSKDYNNIDLFDIYSPINSSSNSSSSNWPIYLFVSKKAVLGFNKLDMLGFLRHLILKGTIPNDSIVVGAKAGIKVQSGNVTWKFLSASFEYGQNQTNVALFEEGLGCFPIQIVQDYSLPINSVAYATAVGVLSIPNLALLVRVISALRIIDDLTYYAYHLTPYDSQFTFLARMSLNFTESKWVVPVLEPVYNYLNLSYQYYFVTYTAKDPSIRGIHLVQTFLVQTQDFWTSSVPLSLLMFLFFHFAYKLLHRIHSQKLSKLFLRFNWFSFLLASVIGENAQYLSFCCFAQMLGLNPHNALQYFNLVISFTVLFIIVVYSCSCYLLLPIALGPHKYLLAESYGYNIRTVVHMTSFIVLRVFNGVVHVFFRQYRYYQIPLLLIVQVIFLCLTVFNRSIYHRKDMLTCHIIEHLFRVLLHLNLLFQVLYLDINDLHKQNVFENLSQTLFWVLAVACVLEYLLSFSLQPPLKMTHLKKHNIQAKKRMKAIQKILQQKQPVLTIRTAKTTKTAKGHVGVINFQADNKKIDNIIRQTKKNRITKKKQKAKEMLVKDQQNSENAIMIRL